MVQPGIAQPGAQQRLHLGLAQTAHGGDPLPPAEQAQRRIGFLLAPCRIGDDDLDGHLPAEILPQPRRGATHRQPAGEGQCGQEHHDRDHPRHRPGQASFRQQPAIGERGAQHQTGLLSGVSATLDAALGG